MEVIGCESPRGGGGAERGREGGVDIWEASKRQNVEERKLQKMTMMQPLMKFFLRKETSQLCNFVSCPLVEQVPLSKERRNRVVGETQTG